MVKIKSSVENISPSIDETNNQSWRLKLDKNENIYGVSNFIISTIKNIDSEILSNYPNYEKLINKLSEFHNISKNNIILYSGIFDILNTIFNVYLDNDDEVLTNQNLSDEIKNLILHNCAEIKNLNCINYETYIETFKQNVSNKTKIFYCASPDNNTGALLRTPLLKILIQNFPDILFIVNCSYINFANDIVLEDYYDLVKKYNNVIVLKSFSYDYALAGLRIGYLYSSDEIVNNLKKLTPSYNVNSVATECASSIINNHDFFDEIKNQNEKARTLLYDSLTEKGFKPYKSEANFILCDFLNYSDFYYQKLKNNGVIVKRYDKSSIYSTCLRITVPKIGGVKYILELLNKKDVIIFNPDGIIFDINNSSNQAIIQAFKHFTNIEINNEDIIQAKNLSGYNCNWQIIKYLLEKNNYFIDTKDIISVFQNIFYNPNSKEENFLIDNEKLLISKEKLEKLSEKYDLVIFSDRQDFELEYSLNKFEINKFFNYKITASDLEYGQFKPSPEGVYKILKHCPYKTIKLIGNTVNDIIAGNKADICTIGYADLTENKGVMVNNFKHLCANYIMENENDIFNFFLENEQI